MVSFGAQLRILLWKNWLLRKRNLKRVVIEILWPLVLFVILMWVRTRGLKHSEHTCHVVEKALPSVGGFEFLQNFVCTLNNTCIEEDIENTDNSRWDDAIFVRIMKETTPLIKDIVTRKEGRQTVTQVWQDGMEYVKIISELRDVQKIRKLGPVKLRNFLKNDGLAKFRESVGTYTGLSSKEVENFLDIKLNLDKFHQHAVEELLRDFRTGNCSIDKKYELVTFPSRNVFQNMCNLTRDKAFMLLFVFGNYFDRPGLLQKLNSTVATEESVRNLSHTAAHKVVNYDFSTLQKLGEIGTKFMSFGKVFGGEFGNLTGTEMAAILIFEGLCGIRQNGNKSVFGVDPGRANRYDSLRDRLKDWNPDHRYENDPEISPACNAVFQRLEGMPLSSLIWRQVKPIIRGYIYYAPDTEVSRMIMDKVVNDFMKLQDIEVTINTVLHLMHHVRLWLHNNLHDLNNFKAFLANRANVEYVLGLMGYTAEHRELETFFQVTDTFEHVNIDESLERLDFASELLSEIVGCVRYNKTKAFRTEWEAVNAGHELLSVEKIWAVVVFSNLEYDDGHQNLTLPSHLYYKIRMDSDKVDGTRSVRDRLTSKGPRRRPIFDIKYITYGFVYLQEMIERAVIELITGKNLDGEHVYLQQYPYPCYIYDQFIKSISRTFPLFMVLSWVYASSMIVKSVVLEKERRLREVMKIMGVTNAAIWLSWFIESFIIMSVSCSILTVILKYGKVIEFSDPLLIWVFLISYTVATICFSFFVSTLFSRANSAAAAGGVLFFISYLPYNMMLVWEEKLEWYEMLISSLVSNVAFGFGCTYFARYEEDGIGAQWDNLTWQSLPDDDFTLIYCLIMLWIDSVLYLILTWYIENVFPGEYGVPRPWYFCFKKEYWKCGRAWKYKKKPNSRMIDNGASSVRMFEEDDVRPEDIEPEPLGFKCGVEVIKLSKTYANGKVALDNLSINFYENQITSFLGHNGAGKTTTISILTGLFPPTKGTALINGMDIRTDMDKIRTNLGICPQYNVLFDRLNVYEHLKFFALLKGKKGPDVEEEFEELLVDLGIPHKRHAFPNSLSGGMKRKLSVAIAFVGGSKTVFLDEPTSGVDPFSRRSIWELMLKYKTGRTVILTTHFMDEADILGDRIAIISRGKLKALGSSLFLKSHFGQGYTLHLVKNEEYTVKPVACPFPGSDPKEKDEKNAIMKHDDLIENFVQSLVPHAVMTENVGIEVAFLLPYHTVPKFSNLFDSLQENLYSLGIINYGISDTSLEDVFLKITVNDLTDNVDSFNALSSSSKRRFVCLLNRCKEQLNLRGNAVTAVAGTPKDLSNNTETTDMCNPLGDFYLKPNDVSLEESRVCYNVNSVTTMFERKRLEDIEANGTASVTEIETVTTSLLDQTGCSNKCAPPAEGTKKTSKRKKLMHKCPLNLPKWLGCLCFSQMFTIIRKRWWNSKRNKKAMFFEIIFPAVFIAITLAFTLILPPATDEPAREITPWTYDSPNRIFFAEPVKTRRKGVPIHFRKLVDELIGPIGMGTACLVDQNRDICEPGNWNKEAVQEFNTSRLDFVADSFPDCSCSIGSQQCPSGVFDVKFPTLKTQTNDYILDASTVNIAEWLVKTQDKFMDSRYGGFEMQLRKPPAVNVTNFLTLLRNFTSLLSLPDFQLFSHHHEKLLEVENETKIHVPKARRVYKVWYENRGWVSSVAYLNALHNMWLREKLPVEYHSQKNKFGITLTNHPMNLTKSQSQKEALKLAGLALVHAICIIFALSFIPASFVVYLIDERKCGGKHLHLVSGVRPLTYWIGNFLFDMMKYLVPTVLCILLFYMFDATAYIGPDSFWAFLVLLLLYGWASIPAMYPFSFFFGVPSTAFVVLACSNLFIGVITTVSTFVIEQFGDPELEAINAVLKKAFLIFPHYCLGRCCLTLATLHFESTAFNVMTKGDKDGVDRFEWHHLGEKMFYLSIHGAAYFLLNLCFEYKQVFMFVFKLLLSKKKRIPVEEEDIDVRKERDRVEHANPDSMTLSAIDLTKYYKRKKHPAVNGITFGIGKGECFGLLGVNGAGKSTTFKMLTGDVRISSGKARICGADVEKNLDKARKHFGYCPQEDSIDPLLTGCEMLTLYGRLRGLSVAETREATARLIKTLGLTLYANRSCGTYSGGNKRKLSTAIALIGDPDVIFLDEPTSGMDPGARRDLWRVILDLLHKGKTVVLTSHSMEECEVLCTKIAIMVNGEFMCMGSLQHLKNRFGKGYTLTIRSPEVFQETLLTRIKNDLPEATLEDQHCSQLKLNIPQESAHLGHIFSALSKYKTEGIVEDYSVSQTTLDDIFVKFASHQRDSLDR